MKKDYEPGKKQRESRNHEENTQVESMIEVVEDQINDLFKEEKNKNGEKTGKINQELLNEASKTAINRGSDWDDLSYVNNMMIDVKMEKLKTNEEGKKKVNTQNC